MLPFLVTCRRPLFWVGAGLAVLVTAGVATERFARPKTVTRSETRRETESRRESQLEEHFRQVLTENQQFAQRIAQSERRQADVNTVTQREIIRYAPGTPVPASSPSPVVVVRDGSPAPAPYSAPGMIAEVVRETITAVDKTRTETASASETTAAATTTTDTERTTTATETESSKTAETAKSETVTGGAKGDSSDSTPLGVALTSELQPALTYDFARAPLGPRVLGLGQIGAGLMVTKSRDAGIDFGPQANLTPGKGNLFVGVGYQVRAKQPVGMVGLRFKF